MSKMINYQLVCDIDKSKINKEPKKQIDNTTLLRQDDLSVKREKILQDARQKVKDAEKALKDAQDTAIMKLKYLGIGIVLGMSFARKMDKQLQERRHKDKTIQGYKDEILKYKDEIARRDETIASLNELIARKDELIKLKDKTIAQNDSSTPNRKPETKDVKFRKTYNLLLAQYSEKSVQISLMQKKIDQLEQKQKKS